MENGTGNPEPSWQQSAYTGANAAAEPGPPVNYIQPQPGYAFAATEYATSAEIGGNRRNTVQTISEDQSLGLSVSGSFVHEQIGTLTILSPSVSAGNNHLGNVNYGYYNAYQSFAPPGTPTSANPWTAAHSNNHASALDIGSYPSQLIEGSYAAGTAYNNSIAPPTAPNSYTWGPAALTTHSNNDAFIPVVTSSHSPFAGRTFAADTAYNDGTAFPSAFTPRTWDAAAPTGPMANYIGAGLQYPDPSFPVMNPFGAGTNGIGADYHGSYHQGQSSAPSFTVQTGPAVQASTASHAAAPLLPLAPPAVPRSTCSACNRSFSRKADLERHAKMHRADAVLHRCPHAGCGYSYYRKDKVDEHARRPH